MCTSNRLHITFSMIAVMLLLGAAGAAPDAADNDMARLEGQWSMLSGLADGQPMPEQMVKTGRRVAKDGQTTITFGEQLYFKAKFTIDATKKPRTIDYDMIEGPTKGK